MLNLLGKALTGMVLDRDARDAMREAGGLASAIQGAADMRAAIQAVQTARLTQQVGGSTPLPSPAPSTGNPIAMANSAALQAALLAQILTEARAAAAAAEKTPYAAPGERIEPTLNTPRATPSPITPASSGPAGGLNAAIMAQALAAAQAAVARGQQMPEPSAPSAPPPPVRPMRGKRLPAAERAALIENALKVHSAKQSILSNLSPEQRAKLTELANKLLDPKSGSQA